MVDFDKLLGKTEIVKDIEPIAIFANLDKESGKEYLRPPQESVLKTWHEKLRSQKDTIIKLHTGQGKTLIGLTILQSYINEGLGPVVYICPNNYLVNQTVEQARSFGFKIVQFSTDSKLPREFLNSEAILVTNCNKLFNGKSVFGVSGSGKEPIQIGAIVIDDAHKCLQIIRDAFSFVIRQQDKDGNPNLLYSELWTLFEETTCIISGNRIEIVPRLLPLELIPSFAQAQRRIFLSATLAEDAFLVRDLGISPESVTNPLSVGDVPYCGERLVLMPTLVETTLKRDKLIEWVSSLASKHGDFGVVAITPSFAHAKKWEEIGAKTTNVQSLYDSINDLKNEVKKKAATKVLVLVNEYDGVDLPDSTCRILCLDSLPSYSSLIDRYMQEIRPASLSLRQQLAQRVEQGMGRAIRGSSDWCIVVPIGNNLTDFLSENSKRALLSKEAQLQIKIGEELAEEMRTEGTKLNVIEALVNQCLKRDDKWKGYYKQRMSKLNPENISKEQLSRSLLEREAEILYQRGHHEKAVLVLQKLISESDKSDTGWFLQLMATYLYPVNSSSSMDKQLKAHSENPQLFRPETGVAYSKLASTKLNRATHILDWIKNFESHSALVVHITNIMDKLAFNAVSDEFEEGIDEIGQALGFPTQRPEKQTGRGPDNFWQIDNNKYWIIECKNMVSAERTGISKSEIGQLSNDLGWFNEYYAGFEGVPVMIHPAEMLKNDAYPTQPFWVFKAIALEELKGNTIRFFNSLSGSVLSEDVIVQKLKEFNLDTENLMKHYLQRVDKRELK